MRTFPAGLTTTIGTAAFKLAVLVKLVRPDGTIFAWTDWDLALSVDIGDGGGALAYSPADMEGISEFAAQLNAPPDDAALRVATDEAALYLADVRKGLFRRSVATISYVDPSALAAPALHRRYDVANAHVEGRVITFELIGQEKRLEQEITRRLTSNCPLLFGDADCGVEIDAAAWAATTAYAVREARDAKSGDIVKPTVDQGFWFKCTVAGTSDSSEPTWPTVLGGTVVDGTVSWEAVLPRRAAGTVTSVTDKRTFTVDVDPLAGVPADWWGNGLLEWATGDNSGTKVIVRDSGASGAGDGLTSITLKLPAFTTVAVGDTAVLVAGCRKRRPEDCLGKWDNNVNFGGDEHLTEESSTVTAKRGSGGGKKG